MKHLLLAPYLFALLSVACTPMFDGQPVELDGDIADESVVDASETDANEPSDIDLSCFLTHADGLFDVYGIAPEVGETFELSLDEAVLRDQQFLRFHNGPVSKLLTLNGSLTGTFTKTVLIDGTMLQWSEGDSNTTTIDIANGELTGTTDPIAWIRVLRSGNYLSHARAECTRLP